MPTYPQTVDGIVEALKARGATFHLSRLGCIRSTQFKNRSGCGMCPLEVLAGRIEEPSIPPSVRTAVINASDGLGYFQASDRAQLLTLCQG